MPVTRVDRLIDHLTDGGSDLLAADLRAWMEGSRRFRAFAETHRDKIRKKVRAARNGAPRLDLRAELAVAAALLADRRVTLDYEAYGATVGGPDFTVSFRSHVAFNLEVTRWRGGTESLRRQLVAKLRQLPPGIANVVLVVVDVEAGSLPDLEAVARVVLDRAEVSADRDARQRLRRLGGLVAWAERSPSPVRSAIWTNPSARIAVPDAAARAVLTSLRDAPASAVDPPPCSR